MQMEMQKMGRHANGASTPKPAMLMPSTIDAKIKGATLCANEASSGAATPVGFHGVINFSSDYIQHQLLKLQEATMYENGVSSGAATPVGFHGALNLPSDHHTSQVWKLQEAPVYANEVNSGAATPVGFHGVFDFSGKHLQNQLLKLQHQRFEADFSTEDDSQRDDIISSVHAPEASDLPLTPWNLESTLAQAAPAPPGLHVPPGLPAPVAFSVGSNGHPYHCGNACKYVKRKGGCMHGVHCPHCHLCFWVRAKTPAQMVDVVPSVGSHGHPHTCAKACKFVKRKGGCRDGAACVDCHTCDWRRSDFASRPVSEARKHKNLVARQLSMAEQLDPYLDENPSNSHFSCDPPPALMEATEDIRSAPLPWVCRPCEDVEVYEMSGGDVNDPTMVYLYL